MDKTLVITVNRRERVNRRKWNNGGMVCTVIMYTVMYGSAVDASSSAAFVPPAGRGVHR